MFCFEPFSNIISGSSICFLLIITLLDFLGNIIIFTRFLVSLQVAMVREL